MKLASLNESQQVQQLQQALQRRNGEWEAERSRADAADKACEAMRAVAIQERIASDQTQSELRSLRQVRRFSF